jgi:RNA polymerase sigma-70 factor, ECF subfamily
VSSSDNSYPISEIWVRKDEGSSTSPTRLDDECLMAHLQSGAEAALGILLDRYSRLVLSIGIRILRDSGEAQELVQDVFMLVYRKCSLFDPKKGAFRTWLIRLASNRAFDRRDYLNLHRFYDNRNLDDFADAIDSAVNVEYQTEVSQGEAVLRKTFEELNPKQRMTLELYFFEGYTLREISDRMHESLPNIRHYYYRALTRLKASFGQQKGD